MSFSFLTEYNFIVIMYTFMCFGIILKILRDYSLGPERCASASSSLEIFKIQSNRVLDNLI